MPERDILFETLRSPSEIFQLKEYLREIYRLLDKRFVSVTRVASITFDADIGEVFYVSLDGNITGITLLNAYKGREITIIFKQDSTGSRTVAGWASTVKLSGAAFTVTSNASRYSIIKLVYDDTNWVESGRSLDVY